MNKYRILVFDVETTGLLPKVSNVSKTTKVNVSLDLSSKDPQDLSSKVPYIIQFSFIMYNLQTRTIERKHDFYINPPIDIPEIITEITGITKETCVKKGVPIMLALDCFYECYNMCNTVIAHNMAFDSAMVRIELERNREEIDRVAHYCLNIFDATFEQSRGIDRFCTMRYGTNICNIMVSRVPLNPSLPLEVPLTIQNIEPSKEPAKYKKWPTLLEFHKHLFDTIPDNLHNSIVDVLVCLRCYLKSCKRITIEDAEFAQIIHTFANEN
jgi:DNA polymerase-3 subunit epsilon